MAELPGLSMVQKGDKTFNLKEIVQDAQKNSVIYKLSDYSSTIKRCFHLHPQGSVKYKNAERLACSLIIIPFPWPASYRNILDGINKMYDIKI